jgi:DNA-directed RNA polymerase subunit D
MDKIEKKENKIIFKAEIEESLANAIRRYLNQIPILAIDEVEIIKNGSALYDEVVAHRLGLIPLKMDKMITEKNKGKLKLATKKEGAVNSGELKGNVKVVYENIPITFLDKDQEIELVGITKAGKGIDHVKFSPGLMFYRNVTKTKIDKNLLEEIKKICSDCNFEEKGDKVIIIDDKAREVADLIEGVANRADKKAEVEVGKELIITLESFGQMDLKDIFTKSVDALKKDLTEVPKKIK